MPDEDWSRPQSDIPGRLANGRNAATVAIPWLFLKVPECNIVEKRPVWNQCLDLLAQTLSLIVTTEHDYRLFGILLLHGWYDTTRFQKLLRNIRIFTPGNCVIIQRFAFNRESMPVSLDVIDMNKLRENQFTDH